MNLPLVKITQNLNVAVSTVHRIYRLKRVALWTLCLHERGWLRSELYVVRVILENLSEQYLFPCGTTIKMGQMHSVVQFTE